MPFYGIRKHKALFAISANLFSYSHFLIFEPEEKKQRSEIYKVWFFPLTRFERRVQITPHGEQCCLIEI